MSGCDCGKYKAGTPCKCITREMRRHLRSTEQIKTEERLRKLLQENTKKLVAREIIEYLITRQSRSYYKEIISHIEKKYGV